MSYSWVPFHKELITKLLPYRNRQSELISFLHDLKEKDYIVVRLTTQYPDAEHEVPLDEIDPFTFFANFNRGISDDNRKKLLKAIKEKFSISAEVPEDFCGIPVVDNMRSWFFNWKYKQKGEIDLLWNLAEVIVKQKPEELDEALYEQVANMKGVGPGMMSMGMYWLNPNDYLALDGVNLRYLAKQELHFTKKEARTLEGYLNIVQAVRDRYKRPFYEISYEAWLDGQKKDVESVQQPSVSRSTETGVRYWVYAPGPQAKYWEECQEKNIMVYGADKLGELTRFKSRGEIQKALKEIYEFGPEPINHSMAAWQFVHEIKPGDIIISKRGMTHYLGYGTVTGDYRYAPDRPEYKHIREVNWIKSGEWEATDHQIAMKTLTDVTKYPDYVERLKELIGIGEKKPPQAATQPLNTILYGPPGTGKTYRLKDKYFDKFTDRTAQTLEDHASELIEGMTWWEVIAIAVLDIGEARVADILEHPLIQARINISQPRNAKTLIWGSIQQHAKLECENVKVAKRAEPLLFWKDERSIWSIDQDLAREEVPELEEKLQEFQDFKPKETEELRYVFTTFHQSYSYEDFIEGIKPVLVDDGDETQGNGKEIAYKLEPGVFMRIADRARANPGKNYAIFIDEINRGNVASILGELITLIEEDKRAGAANELTVTLPYSRRQFSVPQNLFLYGTMNTADRSVEALDTALRRRFSFVELRPEPHLIEQPDNLEVSLEQMLVAINGRIEKLLDKDHCIGHAYFMGLESATDPLGQLQTVFADKVMPLLEEYFYNDPVRLGMVLGSSFVKKKSLGAELAEGEWDIDDLEERDLYDVADPKKLDAEAFRSIYE